MTNVQWRHRFCFCTTFFATTKYCANRKLWFDVSQNMSQSSVGLFFAQILDLYIKCVADKNWHIHNLELVLKSDNLQYNTVERWVAGTTVSPFIGPMFILIDWEYLICNKLPIQSPNFFIEDLTQNVIFPVKSHITKYLFEDYWY